MLVPLYGFLRGDTLGLVVLVQDTDPVSAIAESLQQAASMLTVAEVGLRALDRVDVVGEGEPA
jgi:hypothetical protein